MRSTILVLGLVVCVPALTVVLGGCGGGSSASDVVEVLIPQSVAPGESIGLGVRSSTDIIESVTWRQVSGPSVVLQATRSKVIGFDVASAGSYSFEANVSTAQHGQVTRTLSFNAQGTRPLANVRLDRAIPQRSSASLRVWHTLGSSAQVT
jgi:hypothetical protein